MTSQQNGDLLEELIELAEGKQKILDRQDKLIDMQDKLINELKRHISLLEEELGLFKNCYTCKHLDVYGFEEPCRSCKRCMVNGCTNDYSDKWEPKE